MKSILKEIRDFNAEYKEKTGKEPPDEYTAVLFVIGAFMLPELINPELINNKEVKNGKAKLE